MTKTERKELLRVLNYIKEMCKDSLCSECPLFDVEIHECYLKNHYAEDWNITDNLGDDWRAFYD